MGGTGAPRVEAAALPRCADDLIEQFPALELTRAHIARLAGISPAAMRGVRPTVRLDTLERVQAVRPQHVRLMPPRHVSAEATERAVRRFIEDPDEPLGLQAVARAACVSGQLIHNVLAGQPAVRYGTHVAIVSLRRADVLAEERLIDRRATVTRLHALMANGWNKAALSAMADLDVDRVLSITGPVRAVTARRVQHLYDQIGDEVGPSPHAMSRSRALGYKTPIHYDDDMRLPETDHDARAAQQARMTLCVLLQTVARRPTVQIATTLGVSERAVNRARLRLGVQIERTTGEPVEAWPGQFATAQSYARVVNAYEMVDALDDPDLDYSAMVATLGSAERAA